MASYSRFHAIISATPGTGLPPRPAPYPPPSYNPQTPRHQTHNSPKIDPPPSRQRPTKYASKDLMLDALKLAFKAAPAVDFHGSFESVDNSVSHKQRVQTLTIDIWRATGYRFTVKDHPRINNGHKTRFWCSQDEAHRSKSSKLARLPHSASKPRISSAGDALAKVRYACKSRLLISSRDSTSSTSHPFARVITVRMHHHVAHEPYVDTSLPPELAQAVYESFGWSSSVVAGTIVPGSSAGASTSNLPLPDTLVYPEDDADMDADEGDAEPDDEDDQDEDEDMNSIEPALSIPVPRASASTSASPHLTPILIPIHTNISPLEPPPVPTPIPLSHPAVPAAALSQSTSSTLSQPTSSTLSQPTPNTLPHPAAASTPTQTQAQTQTPAHYHARMHAHISNIRDFCDGLEYQLQFNDYRMLDVLEREGASFLHLVADCLRKEGRGRFGVGGPPTGGSGGSGSGGAPSEGGDA